MARERLIDRFAGEPVARSQHEVEIEASPEAVWAALWSVDVAQIGVAKVLLGLRSVPALLTGKRRELPVEPRPTLRSMQDAGFGKLEEDRPTEVVFGVTGRFWSPAANIDPFDPAAFDQQVVPGRARALWNFLVTPAGDERTRLETETRVFCGDPASRRKFRAYWLFVRPFSGWIRLVMLRRIRQLAEAPGDPGRSASAPGSRPSA